MDVPPLGVPAGPRSVLTRRRNLTGSALVEIVPPASGTLPCVIRPLVDGLSLSAWAAEHREQIEDRLHADGAILFQGFGLNAPDMLQGLMSALYTNLVAEHERSSPRHQVSDKVYSSTDHPADQEIFLHNEMSYALRWPMRVGFACLTSPESGGATPIADVRGVTRDIPADIRAEFDRRGVMYVRNYGDGLGLPWSASFGTDDPAEVDRYCAANAMTAEWKPGGRLRTRRVARATAVHPATGETLWFNHAVFFHISTLEPALRDALTADTADDDLPTNSFYGDGGAIEQEVIDVLRGLYRRHTVALPWQEGDAMLVDNMLAAHGRASFTGERRVLVAMAEPTEEA